MHFYWKHPKYKTKINKIYAFPLFCVYYAVRVHFKVYANPKLMYICDFYFLVISHIFFFFFGSIHKTVLNLYILGRYTTNYVKNNKKRKIIVYKFI